jgi:hypothetical protein
VHRASDGGLVVLAGRDNLWAICTSKAVYHSEWMSALRSFCVSRYQPKNAACQMKDDLMSLHRFLFLAVVFALLLWIFVFPSLNESEVYLPIHDASSAAVNISEEYDAWGKAEQAVWRDQVNQRLYGR